MSTETTAPDAAAPEVVMTVFMLVKTTPEWLGIAVDDRFRLMREHVEPILRRHSPQVRFRFYDVEFYTARATDIWVWDVADRQAYELVIEALRETPFWDRWFQILEILPGVENAYAKNYGREALAA